MKKKGGAHKNGALKSPKNGENMSSIKETEEHEKLYKK